MERVTRAHHVLAGVRKRGVELVDRELVGRHVLRRAGPDEEMHVLQTVDESGQLGDVGQRPGTHLFGLRVDHPNCRSSRAHVDLGTLQPQVVVRIAPAEADRRRGSAQAPFDQARGDAHAALVGVDGCPRVLEDPDGLGQFQAHADLFQDSQGALVDAADPVLREGTVLPARNAVLHGRSFPGARPVQKTTTGRITRSFPSRHVSMISLACSRLMIWVINLRRSRRLRPATTWMR